ncbi:MAG: hypothetical protein ABI068_17490 [Ktedonobacterales bacterium]
MPNLDHDHDHDHDHGASVRLMRVTLIDANDAISVAVPSGLGVALIAALGSDPATIESLLRATDAIYFGAAEVIMGALIAHDRATLRWRRGLGPEPTLQPERDAWPITARATFELARRPAPAGLLLFDLERRTLGHCNLPWPIEPFGEIPIFDGQNYVQRTVTYDVRKRWKIEAVR